MKKYFIYGLYKNDIIFYIGITTNVKNRESNHKSNHGVDIEFKILDEYFGAKDTAFVLEEFWIKKFRDLGYDIVNIKQKEEQRKIKTYKVYDDVYKRAFSRAKADGFYLSELIEKFVMAIAEGSESFIVHNKYGIPFEFPIIN